MGIRGVVAFMVATLMGPAGPEGFAPLAVAGAAAEEAAPAEYVQRPDKLLPEHRRILAESGYLALVEENIDILRYYPWDGSKYPDRKIAIGLATYENGVRTAHIATKRQE